MTTNEIGGSAKIYQFPLRGRYARNGNAGSNRITAASLPFGVKTTACGSSWYHDEAIREEALEPNY